MNDAEKTLLTIITRPLKAAGYSRSRRVWSRIMPETALIVEVLCQSGPPFASCCTIEFGVAVGEADGGYLDIGGALLRDRWGHLLTSAEPWTDWWLGFDTEGPYLTACGERGERLDADTPGRALEGTIIPVLERCSTLAVIEGFLRDRVDWVTGSKLQHPGADDWCVDLLAQVSHGQDLVKFFHGRQFWTVSDRVPLARSCASRAPRPKGAHPLIAVPTVLASRVVS